MMPELPQQPNNGRPSSWLQPLETQPGEPRLDDGNPGAEPSNSLRLSASTPELKANEQGPQGLASANLAEPSPPLELLEGTPPATGGWPYEDHLRQKKPG